LTVFAYVLLIGANSLPGPLTTSISFGNGYSATATGAPNNQAVHAFQGPVRAGDWGRGLDVSLRTDPNDAYRESDENDNTLRVSVTLPSARSTQVIDPLPCQASH
jgi:hypothetical protein